MMNNGDYYTNQTTDKRVKVIMTNVRQLFHPAYGETAVVVRDENWDYFCHPTDSFVKHYTLEVQEASD
jgi:hypothetical protein